MSGIQRLRSGGERSTEGIAYGLEDIAAVSFDGFPEKSIVAGNCSLHSSGLRLPQTGASLYIGEEEGDCALWHIGCSKHAMTSY